MKTLLLTASLIALSNASIINIDASNKIQSVQTDLNTIRLIDGLSAIDTKSLDSLQNQSDRIAQLVYNGNCASVSINSLPNPECKSIAKKMDSFMISYNKFAKRLYVSKMNALALYSDKTEKMQACAEAMTSFVNGSIEPDALYPLNVNVEQEQISDDSIVVNLDIRFINQAFEKKTNYYNNTSDRYESFLVKWNTACYDYTTYGLTHGGKIKKGMPTANFLKTLNELYKNTNLVFGVSPYNDVNIGWKRPIKYEISVVNSKHVVVNKQVVSYDFVYSDNAGNHFGINGGNANCDISKKCETPTWFVIAFHEKALMVNTGSKFPNMSTNNDKYTGYEFTNTSFMLPVDNYTVQIKKIH